MEENLYYKLLNRLHRYKIIKLDGKSIEDLIPLLSAEYDRELNWTELVLHTDRKSAVSRRYKKSHLNMFNVVITFRKGKIPLEIFIKDLRRAYAEATTTN